MFWVKSCCRIKIGVDDYIIVELCVIKSSPIIVMKTDYVRQYWMSIVGD
jgi:hypothetical protein